MAVRRLFENLEIDWERLTLPAQTLAEREPPKPSVSLGAVELTHLRSVRSLLAVYRGAVARGLVHDSEGNLIAFLATAAYCKRVGKRPVALLVHFLKSGERPATLEDEDRACLALKRYLAKQRRGGWLNARKPEMPERE